MQHHCTLIITSRLAGGPSRQTSSEFRVTPLSSDQPYKPGPLAALLSNDHRPPPRPPSRDEHVPTASEQWREQRKHGGGDYSRQLQNKELSRLRKYVDSSYNKPSSLASSDVTLSDDRSEPPPVPAHPAGARRSLDFEQRSSVVTSSHQPTPVFNQPHSFASAAQPSGFTRFVPQSNPPQLVSDVSSAPVNQSAFASLRQNDVMADIGNDVHNIRERIDSLRQRMESELAEARGVERDVTMNDDDDDDNHSMRMRDASVRMFDDVTDRTPQRHSYAGQVRDANDVIHQLPPRYSLAQHDVAERNYANTRDLLLPSHDSRPPRDDVTTSSHLYSAPAHAPSYAPPAMTSSAHRFDGYDEDLPVLPSESPFKQVRATGARDDSVLFESSSNWQQSAQEAMRPKSYAGGLIAAPLTRLEKLQMETSISKSMGTLNVRDLEESAKILVGQELDPPHSPLRDVLQGLSEESLASCTVRECASRLAVDVFHTHLFLISVYSVCNFPDFSRTKL